MSTLDITDVSEPDTCVAIVPLFKGLNHADQLKVAEFAEPELVAKGTTIFMQGDELSSLMVVHRGRIKLSRITPDGHEQIVRIVEPGDFLGEWAFLRQGRSKHTAVTLDETQMCVFDHRDLAAIYQRYPSVGVQMLQTLSERLADTEARLESVISSDVGARLADYLLGLPAHQEDKHLVVDLPLAKKDIASLLDTTPESLSRHLRQFEDSGLIEQHGKRIVLLDVDTLIDLSVAE